ncbi:MAG: MmgE/PrpD family protein [bacterium]
MEKPIAEQLAEFAVSTRYEDLPPEVVAKVKHYLLDVIGCTVRARDEKQAEAVMAVIREQGGTPAASVFARGFKTSPMYAAFANGTMGHIYDYDDDHREGTMHPSVSVYPAVFALGEKLRVPGKDFIRALVLGLEVMIRTGEAFLGKTYYQGFHPTGTCGVFGAALGSSLILGLDARQASWALGLAGSFAAGTLEWATEGSWQKPIQAGQPAMSGVLCASLARQNFVGARTIYDGPVGFIRAYSFKDTYDLGRLTANLGKKWEMQDTSIKVHACCRFAGPVADCAMDLYGQGVRAEDVDRILAKVSSWTLRALCEPKERKYRPQTHVDAQFSLPYVIALSIVRSRTGVDEFKPQVFTDPKILALADRIAAEEDAQANAAYPRYYPATVVATLKNGQVREAHVDYPRGDPENPVCWVELQKKFHSLTEPYFDAGRREAIVRMIEELERLDDLARLADLLR